MKKVLFTAVAILVVAGLAVAPALAGKGGGSGESNTGHLDLYEKTGDPDWDIVEDGARGKLKYNLSGPEFEFVFNGHGLEAEIDYSLIYYPEPQTIWPWPVEEFASGTTNRGGNIHLAGAYDFGEDLDDFKVWLVLTDDIVLGELSGWNWAEYLFENNLIEYDDTDV